MSTEDRKLSGTPVVAGTRTVSEAASLPNHLRPSADSSPNSDAVVTFGPARFTILFSRMIRLEYNQDGSFEDRPSQTFLHRNRPAPTFSVDENEGQIRIRTDHLELTWQKGTRFSHDTLQIRMPKTGHTWHFGAVEKQTLRGAIRTLDSINGPTDLLPGLFSREGWTCIDDSESLVFDDSGMLTHRGGGDALDCWFLGYGLDFQQCLREYCAVAGSIPFLPRPLLGNWWSRYWAYSQEEITGLIEEFRNRDFPLSVCVLDLDWHIRENELTKGWTGYTWEKKLFPDPEGFCRKMHEMGLWVSLNLHPHEGVLPHEEAYPEFARKMGLDPAKREIVGFDVADPTFLHNYLKLLHHPHEDIGVDFWWMDWQQGTTCKLANLDPLYVLNHYHFLDNGRNPNRRPALLSRWTERGGHRYPVAFAGDTIVTWESLAFQPYFTSCGANAGCCYWSADIGGHIDGCEEPELFARWIQLGTFSPVMRLHSTKTGFQDRRPWVQGEPESTVIKEFMQLRHAVLPYLYTLSYQCTTDCIPPVRAMYFDYPSREEAYSFPGQYLFGDLIVAPYVTPIHPETRCSRKVVWLPRGTWYQFFTGERFSGDAVVSCSGTLHDMPVFAKAGAIIPMNAKRGWCATDNPDSPEVRFFAGADGEFVLYEDDGTSQDWIQGKSCTTRLSQKCVDGETSISVDAVSGDTGLIPAQRSWRFVVVGCEKPQEIIVKSDGDEIEVLSKYDSESRIVSIDIPAVDVSRSITVTISSESAGDVDEQAYLVEKCNNMLSRFKLSSEKKVVAKRLIDRLPDSPEGIYALSSVLTRQQYKTIYETYHGAGCEYVKDHDRVGHIVVWNNRTAPGARFSFQSRWQSLRDGGIVPRFRRYDFNRRSGDHKNAVWSKELWFFMFDYGGGLVERAHRDRMGRYSSF